MPGPVKADEALRWIQEAVRAGRVVLSKHFRWDRLAESNLTMDDFYNAIEHAEKIMPYEKRSPVNGGTCWRVFGPSLDEGMVAVGVEPFLDKKRRRVAICTIFAVGERDEV